MRHILTLWGKVMGHLLREWMKIALNQFFFFLLGEGLR